VCNGTTSKNPYENARAPIHIVTGSGGCPEDTDPFMREPYDYSAFRSDDYGYSELDMVNSTHLIFRQFSVVSPSSIRSHSEIQLDTDMGPIDTVTIVKRSGLKPSFDC
ncbi:hypothetical protein Ciccas_002336, partial [Cichlidogyrus casuarinus]